MTIYPRIYESNFIPFARYVAQIVNQPWYRPTLNSLQTQETLHTAIKDFRAAMKGLKMDNPEASIPKIKRNLQIIISNTYASGNIDAFDLFRRIHEIAPVAEFNLSPYIRAAAKGVGLQGKLAATGISATARKQIGVAEPADTPPELKGYIRDKPAARRKEEQLDYV